MDRRNFLKNAAMTGAATLLAQTGAPPALLAGAAQPEPAAPAVVNDMTTDRPGADFMVDVLKSLGFEFVCGNPGSSYRGLYESIVNYGGNQNPKWNLCTHEESAVAMCHGYSKIEGKPLLVCIHGTVGLQHSAMALYNAWCDRAPVFAIVGNVMDSSIRGRDSTPSTAPRIPSPWCGICEVGRPAHHAARLRRIRGARLPDRHDSANTARGAGGRFPRAGRPDRSRRQSAHTQADFAATAAGGFGERCRDRAAAGAGGKSGDRRGARRALAGRHGKFGASWPKRCRRR